MLTQKDYDLLEKVDKENDLIKALEIYQDKVQEISKAMFELDEISSCCKTLKNWVGYSSDNYPKHWYSLEEEPYEICEWRDAISESIQALKKGKKKSFNDLIEMLIKWNFKVVKISENTISYIHLKYTHLNGIIINDIHENNVKVFGDYGLSEKYRNIFELLLTWSKLFEKKDEEESE